MYFEWFFTLNLSLNVQNNDVVQAVYIFFCLVSYQHTHVTVILPNTSLHNTRAIVVAKQLFLTLPLQTVLRFFFRNHIKLLNLFNDVLHVFNTP